MSVTAPLGLRTAAAALAVALDDQTLVVLTEVAGLYDSGIGTTVRL